FQGPGNVSQVSVEPNWLAGRALVFSRIGFYRPLRQHPTLVHVARVRRYLDVLRYQRQYLLKPTSRTATQLLTVGFEPGDQDFFIDRGIAHGLQKLCLG